MMKNDITINDIAGYATPKMVWQMILDLSNYCCQGKLEGITSNAIVVVGKNFSIKDESKSEFTKAYAAPELFGEKSEKIAGASDVWTIGALAFYAITGMDVFEGKGGETQTANTDIPRISLAHAPYELSSLIYHCLNYVPEERPTKEEMYFFAQEALAAPCIPCRKLINQAGKSYTSSLVEFWPEEMGRIVLLCMFLLFPLYLFSQQKADFNKSAIPNEMATLVLHCVDLRSPQNMEKVRKAMDRDMNWTMMDELALDKRGECTTKDIVDVFGLNDIGFGILKRRGGVTNAGGRFRDGRDSRYKYSFIELTVKKGATVHYQISGRAGEQIFAVVPFEKDAQFVLSVPDIPNGELFTDNGVCYIRLKKGIKESNTFTLALENLSGKNMAFVLINYNSRTHD